MRYFFNLVVIAEKRVVVFGDKSCGKSINIKNWRMKQAK